MRTRSQHPPCVQQEVRMPWSGSGRALLPLPSAGGPSVFSPCQRPVVPLDFHFWDVLRSEYQGPDFPHTPVSILPLEVVVQSLFINIQESCCPGQELMTAAYRLEFQDEETQAEHGSHLLQLTGAKL